MGFSKEQTKLDSLVPVLRRPLSWEGGKNTRRAGWSGTLSKGLRGRDLKRKVELTVASAVQVPRGDRENLLFGQRAACSSFHIRFPTSDGLL